VLVADDLFVPVRNHPIVSNSNFKRTKSVDTITVMGHAIVRETAPSMITRARRPKTEFLLPYCIWQTIRCIFRREPTSRSSPVRAPPSRPAPPARSADLRVVAIAPLTYAPVMALWVKATFATLGIATS